MFRYLKQHWLLTLIIVFLVLPLLGFVLGSAGLFAYIYWPNQYGDIKLSQLEGKHSHKVVLAHGVKDNPQTWSGPLREIYVEKNFKGDVLALDWSKYAQSSLRCAIEGKRIGELLGRQLISEQTAAQQKVKSVHLIGHSCGSFVVYGACQTLKKSQPAIVVQTTYLDPVSIYGLFWDYGLEHFGDCANYSEAYIDTEDGIPGSNELIPHTHTYDVTALRKTTQGDINPHLWPTNYYQDLVDQGKAPEFHHDPSLINRKPPGILEQLP